MEVRGPPPPAGELKKLKLLGLQCTQIPDAGCAALATALDGGAQPAFHAHICKRPLAPRRGAGRRA